MRIIPKDSRIQPRVWKNLNLFDVLAVIGLFAIGTMIFMSNLAGKWVILLLFITMSVGLFLEVDGIKIYNDVGQAIRYAAAKKLFDDKKKRSSIDRLIPYTGFKNDGTIDYGEYYGRVIEVGTINFWLQDAITQEICISNLGRLFNSLTLNQSAQLIKIDRPIIYDDYAQRLLSKIVKERQSKNNEKKLLVLQTRLDQIDTLNNIQRQYIPAFYLVFYDTSIDSLNELANYTVSLFAKMKIKARKLDLKETGIFLRYNYTRSFDERDFEDYKAEEFMQRIKPKSIHFTSSNFEIDKIKAFSLAIADYPIEVPNAWGAELFAIDNTKITINIVPVDAEKARRRIDRVVAELASRENEGRASDAIDKSTQMQTMGSLITSLRTANEKLFDCTAIITAYHNSEERLDAFRKQIQNKISGAGFRPTLLRMRQIDAFISSNISRRTNLRRYERGINTMSLAAIFPFVSSSLMETNGVLLGYGDFPVSLDIFKRTTDHRNSNIVIAGSSGSGKSFCVKTLLTNLYPDNTRIFILDPEDEYSQLCDSVEGTYIDVGSGTKGRINPFHIYLALEDNDNELAQMDAEEHLIYSYKEHLCYLESFFRVVMPGLTADALELLNNLVLKCYESRKILATTDYSEFAPSDFPTFDDLHSIVKKEIQDEQNAMVKNNLIRLESYVAKFSSGGRYSAIWNGESTLLSDSDFTVFNFQSLFKSKNAIIASGQLLTVMRFLEQQVIQIGKYNHANPNSPIRVIISVDEGWIFINNKNSEALDAMMSWGKRIRKYGGGFFFITQNLADFMGNEEIRHKTSAILNNAQYTFLFRLAPGDLNALVDLYKGGVGINSVEQNMIATADVGQAFFMASPTERMSFQVVAAKKIGNLFNKEKL